MVCNRAQAIVGRGCGSGPLPARPPGPAQQLRPNATATGTQVPPSRHRRLPAAGPGIQATPQLTGAIHAAPGNSSHALRSPPAGGVGGRRREIAAARQRATAPLIRPALQCAAPWRVGWLPPAAAVVSQCARRWQCLWVPQHCLAVAAGAWPLQGTRADVAPAAPRSTAPRDRSAAATSPPVQASDVPRSPCAPSCRLAPPVPVPCRLQQPRGARACAGALRLLPPRPRPAAARLAVSCG